MAELLIRTVDKETAGDPLVDRHRMGRGCVVVIMPDGHQWSEAEKTAPFWRIVKLPGVAPAALSPLVAGDVGYGNPDSEKINRVLRRRIWQLDVAALEALLADPTARHELLTQPVKAIQHFQNIRQARPVLQDPAILVGAQRGVRVIG